MKRLIIMLLVFSLLLVTGGSTWAVVSLPTANISGNAQTTAGNDTGSFVLVHAFISKVNYPDGTSTSTNGSDESIIGADVTVTNAVRESIGTIIIEEQEYSIVTFTDAVLTISNGTFNYLTADLSNITFVTDEIKWYLNPGLDVCNQTSHNLSNFILNTDANHPSRYIDEFQSGLDINNISGMKIILDVIPDGGSITGDGSLSIFVGLIMGPPPIIEVVEVPRSVGYWKNHGLEINCFAKDAVSDSIDELNVFSSSSALRYFLSKTGKKSIEEKVKQHLAALLLNIAAGLDPSELLTNGQLAILREIATSYYGVAATIGDAVFEIENAIITGYYLERTKDLAEEINTQ